MSKILTGKYAQLRDDLILALTVGSAVEAANPEDGGTCNFETLQLYLPRWKHKLVEQAAKEAGTRGFTTTAYGSKIWLFPPNTNGQANARTRNAEAMAKIMHQRGYDASVWYQMD